VRLPAAAVLLLLLLALALLLLVTACRAQPSQLPAALVLLPGT
jgi:hypothetical protein